MYKQKKFVNIEAAYEEISKDIGGTHDIDESRKRIPDEDVTPFCLWLKNELAHSISKVSLSKRLKDTPAIVIGQVSSSMRMFMNMMEQH